MYILLFGEYVIAYDYLKIEYNIIQGLSWPWATTLFLWTSVCKIRIISYFPPFQMFWELKYIPKRVQKSLRARKP